MTPVQLLTKLEALRDTLRRLGFLDVVSMAMMAAAIVGVCGAVLRVVTGVPTYPVVGGAALFAAAVAGAAPLARDAPRSCGAHRRGVVGRGAGAATAVRAGHAGRAAARR